MESRQRGPLRTWRLGGGLLHVSATRRQFGDGYYNSRKAPAWRRHDDCPPNCRKARPARRRQWPNGRQGDSKHPGEIGA